jgi:hypothetical protein
LVYISPFLVCCTKKNLATLMCRDVFRYWNLALHRLAFENFRNLFLYVGLW